jgi:hypothetical protein
MDWPSRVVKTVVGKAGAQTTSSRAVTRRGRFDRRDRRDASEEWFPRRRAFF